MGVYCALFIIFFLLIFQASQLSGFTSKVEVISETTIIGNTGNLASGSAHDTTENSSIFAALSGTGTITNEHSQLVGTTSR